MSGVHPSVFIIVLNWNNVPDTIECLQSLMQLNYSNFTTVIIDNGSSDNSVVKITDEIIHLMPVSGLINLQSSQLDNANLSAEFKNAPGNQKTILIRSPDNLGFAKGSNLGIQFAMQNNADYIFLLNNDTTCDAQALHHMVTLLEDKSEFVGTLAQVRNYYNRKQVCNCGGKLLKYGARKYYFDSVPITEVPSLGFMKVSFINNCAAMYRSSLFNEVGLLTEKFFFGEEDFELSLRLKKKNKMMACCFPAVVNHKVSQTVNEAFNKNNLGKYFIYYLNRFIDMRNYMNRWTWQVWRFLYLFYIYYLLRKKYRFPSRQLLMFAFLLMKYSNNLKEVDKVFFEKAMLMDFNPR
jgi:GT2 family glycosyltransferase